MLIRKYAREFFFIVLTIITIYAVMSMFFICQECKNLSQNCSTNNSMAIGNLTIPKGLTDSIDDIMPGRILQKEMPQ